MTFVQVWVGYAVFGCLLFSSAFLWAVRQGQFHDMDEARFLALDKSSHPDQSDLAKPSKADRAAVAGLLVVALGVLVAVTLLAWWWTP